MRTRKMNTRITFFEKSGGQNEDGEVVDSICKKILTCWAEVSKTTVRDFRESSSGRQTDYAELSQAKDTKVFLIRYIPNVPFDNSMFVEFNGLEYRIVDVEIDYASKDMIMVKAVRVS